MKIQKTNSNQVTYIEKLGNQIIEAVKKQSGIELEWEIKRVGRNINNG